MTVPVNIVSLLQSQQQIGPDRPSYEVLIEGAPSDERPSQEEAYYGRVIRGEWAGGSLGWYGGQHGGGYFVTRADGRILVTFSSYVAGEGNRKVMVGVVDSENDLFFNDNRVSLNEWSVHELQRNYTSGPLTYSSLLMLPDRLLLFVQDPGVEESPTLTDKLLVYSSENRLGTDFTLLATIREFSLQAYGNHLADRWRGVGLPIYLPDMGSSGRILVPATLSGHLSANYAYPASFVFYSDDRGQSWSGTELTAGLAMSTQGTLRNIKSLGYFHDGTTRQISAVISFSYGNSGTYMAVSSDAGESWSLCDMYVRERTADGLFSGINMAYDGYTYLYWSDAVEVFAFYIYRRPTNQLLPTNGQSPYARSTGDRFTLDLDDPSGGEFSVGTAENMVTVPVTTSGGTRGALHDALREVYGPRAWIRHSPGTWVYDINFDMFVEGTGLQVDLSGLVDGSGANLSQTASYNQTATWEGPIWPRRLADDGYEAAWITDGRKIALGGTSHYAAGSIAYLVGSPIPEVIMKPLPVKSIQISRAADMASSLRLLLDNTNGQFVPDQLGEWEHVLWPNRLVIVRQGYGEQLTRTFTGHVDQVDMTSWPQELRLDCGDLYKRATDQLITTPDGNHVVQFEGEISNAVATLANWAGYSDIAVEPTGLSITKQFSYETFADAFGFYADIAGFEVFCDENGVFRFRPDTMPDPTPVYTFEEGKDIVRLGYTISDQDAYSQVIVIGRVPGSEEALVYKHDIPLAPYYNIYPHKRMVVQASEAESTEALESIALGIRARIATRVRIVEWQAIAVPWLTIGSVVQVFESGSTISEIYRIRDLEFTQTPDSFLTRIRAYWYAHPIDPTEHEEEH